MSFVGPGALCVGLNSIACPLPLQCSGTEIMGFCSCALQHSLKISMEQWIIVTWCSFFKPCKREIFQIEFSLFSFMCDGNHTWYLHSLTFPCNCSYSGFHYMWIIKRVWHTTLSARMQVKEGVSAGQVLWVQIVWSTSRATYAEFSFCTTKNYKIFIMSYSVSKINKINIRV